jgi:hypothetical protein
MTEFPDVNHYFEQIYRIIKEKSIDSFKFCPITFHGILSSAMLSWLVAIIRWSGKAKSNIFPASAIFLVLVISAPDSESSP